MYRRFGSAYFEVYADGIPKLILQRVYFNFNGDWSDLICRRGM